MAAFRAVGKHFESQRLIEIGGEDRSLEGRSRHGGAHKEALIEGRKNLQGGSHFFAKTRGSEPYRRILHTFRSAGDVTADRSQSSAGIFDQRAHDHVCSDIGRLSSLDKLAVAVVHHADDVRADTLYHSNRLADLRDTEGAPALISFGPLDRHKSYPCIFESFPDAFKIEGAVGKQVHLLITDPVFCQGSP